MPGILCQVQVWRAASPARLLQVASAWLTRTVSGHTELYAVRDTPPLSRSANHGAFSGAPWT